MNSSLKTRRSTPPPPPTSPSSNLPPHSHPRHPRIHPLPATSGEPGGAGSLAWSRQCLLSRGGHRDGLQKRRYAGDLDPPHQHRRRVPLPHRLGRKRRRRGGTVVVSGRLLRRVRHPSGSLLGRRSRRSRRGKRTRPRFESERGAPLEHARRVLGSGERRAGRIASEAVGERPCRRLRSLLQPTIMPNSG